jgi:hypothetical protein
MNVGVWCKHWHRESDVDASVEAGVGIGGGH